MTAPHSTLSGADLHELKGVATAASGAVATASGGATVWQKITTTNVDSTSLLRVNEGVVTASLDDVSTASFVLIPLPKCTVNTVYLTLSTGITVADSTVTFTNSTGPATLGTKTITQSGSTEGTSFTFTATTNNAFTTGTYLKVATDGASTTAAVLSITVIYTKT